MNFTVKKGGLFPSLDSLLKSVSVSEVKPVQEPNQVSVSEELVDVFIEGLFEVVTELFPVVLLLFTTAVGFGSPVLKG
jgi:hypothetical protein